MSTKDKAFKLALQERGIDSYGRLAELLNLNPSTLSHHLKAMRSGSGVSTSFLSKLSALLQINVSDLTKLFRAAGNDDYKQEVHDVIGELETGEKYTLITSQPPWEFSDPDMASRIAAKLKEGVQFCYVFPDSRDSLELNPFKDFYFSALPHRGLEWTLLADNYSNFCLDLTTKESISGSVIQNQLKAYFSRSYFVSNPITSFIYKESQMEYSDEMEGTAFIEFWEHSDQNPAGRRSWQRLPRSQCDIIKKALDGVKTEENEVERHAKYRA